MFAGQVVDAERGRGASASELNRVILPVVERVSRLGNAPHAPAAAPAAHVEREHDMSAHLHINDANVDNRLRPRCAAQFAAAVCNRNRWSK